MLKTLFTLIFCFTVYCCGFSQSKDDYNWVFGDSCGLNFSSGEPEFFETAITSFECSASISDTNGNLLFYTDGENVWDRENHVMPNGDSLEVGATGGADWWGSSLTQGVSIVPQPSNKNLYYIFYLTDPGLSYSIVDMKLNSGLGDVTNKNVALTDGAYSEKMQSVKHANGRDWWLITRVTPPYYDSAWIFYMYLITPDSIKGPFLQTYADLNTFSNNSGVGQMKFNKEGTLAALTRRQYIDLYDFDRCTGLFSNYITIDTAAPYGSYGLEFSPDGNFIYVATEEWSHHGSVVQFCLNCDEPIYATKKIIYQNQFDDYWVAQLQLAPDDKIYISEAYYIQGNFIYSPVNMHLHVINNPNELGAACDFDTLTIDLMGHRDKASLPNMPNYNLGPLIGSGCDTIKPIPPDTTITETEYEGIFLPNAFSPNNDGINDVFSVVCHDCTAFVSLTIVNRWGETIFISNNALNGWDGTLNGKPQPMGVYSYFVYYETVEGVNFKTGNVTVVY